MKFQWGYFNLERGDRTIPEELRRARSPRLSIWNVGFKRFQELALFPNLVEVKILNYPLDTFAPLGSLPTLRRLEICHFPRTRSLEPLATLSRLQDLTLKTLPSWDGSGKRHIVDSLRPLADLKNVRKILMTGVVARDGDLSPLGALKNLRDIDIANIYSQEQLARLAGRLPKRLCRGFLRPFVTMHTDVCKKCGTRTVMLSGCDIRPGVICPVCKKKMFETCVNRFEEIARSAG